MAYQEHHARAGKRARRSAHRVWVYSGRYRSRRRDAGDAKRGEEGLAAAADESGLLSQHLTLQSIAKELQLYTVAHLWSVLPFQISLDGYLSHCSPRHLTGRGWLLWIHMPMEGQSEIMRRTSEGSSSRQE